MKSAGCHSNLSLSYMLLLKVTPHMKRLSLLFAGLPVYFFSFQLSPVVCSKGYVHIGCSMPSSQVLACTGLEWKEAYPYKLVSSWMRILMTFLMSCDPWVLSNIMTQSSHCFKCKRNSGFKIVSSRFSSELCRVLSFVFFLNPPNRYCVQIWIRFFFHLPEPWKDHMKL
jgi:hypothetical protein